MKNPFELVETFNRDLLEIPLRSVELYNKDEFELSVIQLEEEIQEFKDAYAENDLGEVVDAMVDLIYFAIGVMYKQGVPAPLMAKYFESVHNANMQKVAGKKASRGFDGDAVDAGKPADWIAPDFNKDLKEYLGDDHEEYIPMSNMNGHKGPIC